MLAAGTDGRDGASEDAGAIVDGEHDNACAGRGLRRCRAVSRLPTAGSLLEATGDLIHTGPTGTNVGDLVMRRSG